LFAVSAGLIVWGPHERALAQTSHQAHARGSASADSAIYAVFFETVNRDPKRDTIYVEETSAVFPGVSSHYDSVAPGLSLALSKASRPPRPTASLHIPPPIRILPATAVKRISNHDSLSSLGVAKGRAQGPMGLWRFSPIVYSVDGNDAMFFYSETCGHTCGENTVVWARKHSAGSWEVRRTAILSIY
jgi:hypothetical protein